MRSQAEKKLLVQRYNVEAASVTVRKKQRAAKATRSDAPPKWIVDSFAAYQKKKAAQEGATSRTADRK